MCEKLTTLAWFLFAAIIIKMTFGGQASMVDPTMCVAATAAMLVMVSTHNQMLINDKERLLLKQRLHLTIFILHTMSMFYIFQQALLFFKTV